MIVELILVAALGLLVGSFLNVVVHRVPMGASVVSPRSACPACGHRIRARDNIPVLSWLLLRGRCRDCGARISARYPLVEAGTAVFFVVVAWVLLPNAVAASGPQLAGAIVMIVAFLYLAATSVALALIDLGTHRLPDALVLPGYLVGAVLLTAAGLLLGEPARLLSAAVGAAALFAFYLVLALIRPDGMGMGDVKLAGVLGMFLGWLGWGALVVGAFAAFVLGGVFGIALVLARRAGRRTRIPFGPWMLLGAWVGIVFGEAIAGWYLSIVGLA